MRERVMALDLGERRVGVAVSDDLGLTAQPRDPVLVAPAGARTRDAGSASAWPGPGVARRVAELVAELGAARVIVGLPRNMNGTFGPSAEAARAFADLLRRALPAGVAVEEWDERLTTAQAERALIGMGVRRGRRRAARDSLAAAILLQSWLDRHRASGYTTF